MVRRACVCACVFNCREKLLFYRNCSFSLKKKQLHPELFRLVTEVKIWFREGLIVLISYINKCQWKALTRRVRIVSQKCVCVCECVIPEAPFTPSQVSPFPFLQTVFITSTFLTQSVSILLTTSFHKHDGIFVSGYLKSNFSLHFDTISQIPTSLRNITHDLSKGEEYVGINKGWLKWKDIKKKMLANVLL